MSSPLRAELLVELDDSVLNPIFVAACRRAIELTQDEALTLVLAASDTLETADDQADGVVAEALRRLPEATSGSIMSLLSKTGAVSAPALQYLGAGQAGFRTAFTMAEDILFRALVGFAAWDELDATARAVLVAPFCIATNFVP